LPPPLLVPRMLASQFHFVSTGLLIAVLIVAVVVMAGTIATMIAIAIIGPRGQGNGGKNGRDREAVP